MLISLLDIVLQNQMPRGGLLGGGAPPEANPLAALAGAQQGQEARASTPASAGISLDPEEEERIRQQQLINTGLGILASNPSQGTAGRLAQGFMVGQELSREAKQDLLEQKIDLQKLAIDLREEERETAKNLQVREIFSNADLSDPQQRTQVMQQLLQGGAFKAAQRLNQFEANMPEVREVENVGEIVLYDPRTLEKKGTIQTPDERPEGTQVINRGTRSDLIDKNTGEVIASFSHGLSPSEIRDRQETVFKRTDSLADDFRSETGNLQESLLLAEQAAGAPAQDPAAQQTLVIALNKLLDPGSVVRQSEFARVQEIGGFTAEAQTFANRLMEEGQLPPEVEQRIRDEIARLAQKNRAQLESVADQYRERAQTFGVNPDFVVRQGLIEEQSDDDSEEEDGNPFGDI